MILIEIVCGTFRHCASLGPFKPNCTHSGRFANRYKCQQLSLMDVKSFHQRLYREPVKAVQDQFLVQHMVAENVKRRRVKAADATRSPSTYTVKYYVTNCQKERIPVCFAAFLRLTGVSKNRLNLLSKKMHHDGFLSDHRGGFRQASKYEPLKEDIKAFIKLFPVKESHYCRSKVKRNYLSSELNIQKMYRLYRTSRAGTHFAEDVKASYFRFVFVTHFNLGFGSPVTDACSLCISLRERIRTTKGKEADLKILNFRTQYINLLFCSVFSDHTEKQNLRVERELHKKRARAFYDFAKDDSDGVCIIAFDCEKNQPLPKVPDSSAYYSRQLYLYNFTVVIGPSRCPLTPTNVKSFCWFETQFAKDSNTIASCVFHILETLDFSQYKSIRLVADGCAGQNKNSIMLFMCMNWLFQFAPPNIKKLTLVFPVTGHSYINPDRVFGNIERETKKQACIIQPEELLNIIKKHAEVLYIPETVTIYDYRTISKQYMKPTDKWPFHIKSCKRLLLEKGQKNVLIRGEVHYGFDMLQTGSTLLKKNKTLQGNVEIPVIPISNVLSAEKKNDVHRLLIKHFGDDWEKRPDLQFYCHALSGSKTRYDLEEVEHNCEFYEEPLNFIV